MNNYSITEKEFIALIERLSNIASSSSILAALDKKSGTYLEEKNQKVEIGLQFIYQLLSSLKNLPSFSSYKHGGIAPSPELRLGGDEPNLALWLLAQSRLLGAEAAYKRLCYYLVNPISLQAYYALWGVRPSERLELAPNVYITPIEEIPPSSMRDAIIIPNNTINPYKMRFPHIRLGVSSVITFSIPNHRIFINDHIWDEANIRPNQNQNTNIDQVESEKRAEIAYEIIRILPLIVKRSIKHTHSWYQADFDVPLIGGSRLAYTSPFEHPTFSEVIEEHNLRPEDVGATIKKYLSWQKSDREKIHLALDRLNRAMRATEIRDHAIDLGIVLESILTKADETGELTYKIKLCGARMLGGNTENMKRNFDFFGKIYNIRSRSVHGQNINKVKDVSHFGNFLRKGDDVAAKLILTIIERGRMPDLDGIVFGEI